MYVRVLSPGETPVRPLRVTWLARVMAVVLGASVLLALASLVLPRLPFLPALRDPAQPWVVLLDVRDEGSVHTWFNVLLLVSAAAAACATAAVTRATGGKAWPWWVVAGVLATLSLDDMLSLHERLELVGERLGGGALHFAWVVPGAVAGVVMAAVVLLAARGLPPLSRTSLLAGTTLLLVAALGLEALSGAVISTVGDGAVYIVVSHVEELVESVAACAFLHGVLRGLRWRVVGGTLAATPVTAAVAGGPVRGRG